MTPAPAAIAGVACRHEVSPISVVPVMVKVINNQGISVLRVDTLPADHLTAPMACMHARADRVIEDDAMDIGPAVCEGQRMTGELAHPVALHVKRALNLIRRTVTLHALIMPLAKPLCLVGPGASSNRAACRIPEVVDISVVIKAPSVHLTQDAGSLVRLRAAFYRALLRSRWSLERAERVTVFPEANAVCHAVAVRVMPIITAFHRASPHGSILTHLRARDPGFYGATYCCGCSMHLPVGAHGEFVWVDQRGRDTEERVGT